jgi:hypothetical protein
MAGVYGSIDDLGAHQPVYQLINLCAKAVVFLELTYCTRYELALSADVRAFDRSVGRRPISSLVSMATKTSVEASAA